ncbi:hypothetical protein DFH08DRAFT_1087119 [Mycena albidolilacea]|uniref:Uncharacterized protein n=1 Tax=Mycena albidolilacea TaxID=1033008 RepID=A0AAD6ZBZ1_9AGAR|nr:hypothetical protein DFH08DRAFT_1087119 [Mycena albidolilacea]
MRRTQQIQRKSAVVPADIVHTRQAHLKKHKATNGFKDVFAMTTARERALTKAVREHAFYVKASIRNIILGSMPGKKRKKSDDNKGSGLTALVTALTKKCRGTSENVTPQDTIWCAILRDIIRENPQLPNLQNSGDEPKQPAKRNHDGSARQGRAAEGNNFFSIIGDQLVML